MKLLADVAELRWDVLIVGSGMGGSTLALQLVRQGLTVLVVERGARITARSGSNEPEESERFNEGFWPEPLTVETPTGAARILAPLGCAVGGSTIHYAAALERLAPSDFEPLLLSSGESVAWPVSWTDFQVYYERAERLFGLDITRPAWDRLSPWDLELARTLRANGFKPEVLNVAMRFDERCEECVGRLCPRGCKADAAVTCIDEAARHPCFQLLEHCEATKIDASAASVHGVWVEQDGVRRRLCARIVVLAAGALHSPRLLLRSRSPSWPDGLANASGLVGRNLMFHTVDFLAIWSLRRLSRKGRQKKALSVRDLYQVDGQRFGYAQSLGKEVGQGEIAVWLKNMLGMAGIRSAVIQRVVAGVLSRIAAKWLGSASLFVLSAEDDPDPLNRIILDECEPDGLRICYGIPEELRQRAASLRARFQRSLRPWLAFPLFQAALVNYGHSCGTCRSGSDPARSVLDRDCRAHGIDNLFVVDASFFPRSGAANPSLTIAANALRVAEAIVAQLRRATRQLRHARGRVDCPEVQPRLA